MTFALGLMCGLIIGCCVTWLAYTWLQPLDLEEHGVSLFPIDKNRAPACSDDCNQGRACTCKRPS